MPDRPPKNEFKAEAAVKALDWKRSSLSLPEPARAPGYYCRQDREQRPLDICFPASFASYNLLPDIRDPALELFARHRIVWHDDIDGGPSNHLLDSQVQCVNALAAGLHDPSFVVAAFAGILAIDQVLPMEDDLYVTFEYIGAENHLGERVGHERQRGNLSTSTDAAIRYRSRIDGQVEVALIEWKYTEDYRGQELSETKGQHRQDRYRPLWEAEDCPIDKYVIPYADLFVEPFYQLMRQQLLARRMEAAGELGAVRVRIVHFCPGRNLGVRNALDRESQRSAGDDTLAIWATMVRPADRFVSVDSERFVELRGGEYARRYNVRCGGENDGDL